MKNLNEKTTVLGSALADLNLEVRDGVNGRLSVVIEGTGQIKKTVETIRNFAICFLEASVSTRSKVEEAKEALRRARSSGTELARLAKDGANNPVLNQIFGHMISEAREVAAQISRAATIFDSPAPPMVEEAPEPAPVDPRLAEMIGKLTEEFNGRDESGRSELGVAFEMCMDAVKPMPASEETGGGKVAVQ